MSIDVSVIIPTFHRNVQLIEAVQSALAQADAEIEILVFDDSPEASARNVIERLENPRVNYFQMERPSAGKPALVRNTGWPLAKGRYIHFLDDDDRVEPGAYRALIAALDRHPKIGVAFGRIEPFGDDPTVLSRQKAYFQNAARRARLSHRLRSRHLMVLNMLFKDTVLVNSACMIRTECVSRIGGYDPDCLIEEDVDFYIRAIRRFGCLFLDRTIIHYRTGAPSLMHNLVDNTPVVMTYRHMYAKYRRDYSAGELFALKILARTALRWI